MNLFVLYIYICEDFPQLQLIFNDKDGNIQTEYVLSGTSSYIMFPPFLQISSITVFRSEKITWKGNFTKISNHLGTY